MDKKTRYRLYWGGKSPKVRVAVEDYMINPDQLPRNVAKKHGISVVSLENNMKRLHWLEKKGLIDLPKTQGVN